MKLADYTIEEKLYQSNRFTIYRAVGGSSTAHYVLKVLDKKIEYKTGINAVENEYRLLKQIDSENVIKAIDWIDDANYAIIVLEDIHGNDLKEFIREETLFSIIQFLDMAVLITNGLAAIHRQSIIHKDINPANIIWNPEKNRLKIIDFDISSKFEIKVSHPGNPEKLQGTLPYISPEQTGRMNRRIDQRSDLYSLGVTFYEMLTGKLPFPHSDPMEIVHAHLARVPERPHRINGHIPEILSNMILKLLAKNPEERYQSAVGLKHDLEKLLELKRSGNENLEGFKIGEKDVSGKLQIPEKLYGRQKETEQLLSAYQRVTKGTKEMIFVSGYSGVGKTALVNEIHKPITKDRGYFIAGKFDQLQRNIPYFALIQAFNQFCNLLLTESQEILSQWKERILQAIGEIGKVLLDIIPNLEWVIGRQPEVPEVGGEESRNRMHFVFKRFIQAISTKEHPLIMFIDDLQWADSSSLDLLKLFLSDNQNHYLLFVGAYRDNEVSPSHPLMTAIEELKGEEGMLDAISTISLKNLTLENTRNWLQDTLKTVNAPDIQQVEGLSRLIYKKTQGNAFFTVQFLNNLYKQNMLRFDFRRERWVWDISEIEQLNITDNVVELLAQKIKMLSENVQEILKLASCIGNIFTLHTLSKISRKSQIELEKELEIAVIEQILYPLSNNTYKFVHDRVHQAAYTLIAEKDKKPLHLNIGRLLLETFGILDTANVSKEAEQHIFDIVNHLNIGIEMIENEREKIELARLNLKAGQKAKASAAYQLASSCLRKAICLLPEDSWQRYYDITLTVYNEAIQTCYLCNKYEEVERLEETILKFAVNILDKSSAYAYRMMSLMTKREANRVVQLAFAIFSDLGLKIPKSPGKWRILLMFLRTKWLLRKHGLEGLKNLPPMTDPKKQLALRLYMNVNAAIVLTVPHLYPVVITKLLSLSLKYGATPETPHLLNDYGFLNIFQGNIKEGCRLGKVSLDMLKNLSGHESMKVRLLTHSHHYIYHWNQNYKDVTAQFFALYQRALNVGDLEFAAYNIMYYFTLQHHIGTEISDVKSKGDVLKNTIEQTLKQPLAKILLEVHLDFISSLGEKNSHRDNRLNRSVDTYPPGTTEYLKTISRFLQNLFRMTLGFLFEDYFILDFSDELKKAPLLKGVAAFVDMHFFSSLVRLQLYRTSTKTEKAYHAKKVRQSLKKMGQWATIGPMNFQHRYYLMQAELHQVTGKQQKAVDYYDKAIKSAHRHGFLFVEAIANELAAKFHMRNHRDGLAEFYFQKAWQCYRKWGAKGKVKHLEENYPKYLSMSIPGSKRMSTGTISSVSADTTDELLDVKSIIKASQTLSGEVKLARLLEKMMQILVENAGAQKSMLIENIDGRLLVQAEGVTDGISGILQRQPVEESENVPLSVINYVARSEKKLVFDNIFKDPNYSSDPYIQKHQPKSVVCFPIVRKDELSAIIYLENNLVEGAFTPARLNVLNTLSSQIAISIENARIYRDLAELNKSLEQKVAERTRQLEEMDKAKSRFFANISHEFRTPLTLIMGPLEKKLSLCRDEQDLQEIRMMLRNSRRLLNLVNQLLELARLESGKMKLEASRQNVVPFVKNIVMCFESLAAQDKVDLIFNKQEENITVYFDPEKLEKIMTNLLSNAFKYTPAGGEITVSVRRLAGNDRFPSGYAEISVRDTGTGIPRDQLPHIFDRFYRGEGGHEYKGKGAGIGLALTRELVDLHHGEIEAQSSCRDDDSRGSEFLLRLPMGEEHLQPEEIVEEAHELHELSRIKQKLLGEVQETPRRGEPIRDGIDHEDDFHSTTYTRNRHLPPLSEKSPPGGRGQDNKDEPGKQDEPVILVVDDNDDVRTYIKSSLGSYFKVIEAADGKEGILRAKEIIPDLIVSDVMMPETDGYELCRILKKDVLTCHVPIILLTARVSEESVLEGLETGADDYITKPFSTELLAVRVRNLIDLRRQLQLEQKNRMAFQPGDIPVSPLDDEFYKKLQDTIETHLSDPDFSVEALCRVLDMSQATLYRKVHGLTGKSPTLFLRSFRIKRAAQLLQANAGSVSDVAVKVGFPDKSYFARCFKEQFHCLPSDVQSSGVSEPVEENEINQKFLRGGPGGAVFSKSAPPGRRRQDIILVVEDSEDTRTYIRQSLEPDYHVVEAVDGSEGIARAMEIIPDLVISDIMMPGMDGYELCRALKQDVRSCHIPVVLLTAKAAEESKIKGLELGADDYITKPFNTQILLARIKNLIQLRSHLQEKRNREMTLLPVKISEPEIDREFMKELNAVIEENLEDPDFNVEQLAKKLYMSSATLYRKVQALSGEIPSEYIRSYRLRRAAQLFKENFGSVTEVAFEVGFNSRTYFTKCFKEKFHQLPSVYMAIE